MKDSMKVQVSLHKKLTNRASSENFLKSLDFEHSKVSCEFFKVDKTQVPSE